MKRWIIKLLEWLSGNRRETKPEPPVINDTPASGGAETNPETDVADVPCADLPVTATVSSVKHVKGKTTWAMTGTASWPKKTVKKEVQGQTYLYIWRGGKWAGKGKFDWFTPSQSSKDHKNIEGGYLNILPEKGERVAFGLVDVRNAQRSNFVEGVWP